MANDNLTITGFEVAEYYLGHGPDGDGTDIRGAAPPAPVFRQYDFFEVERPRTPEEALLEKEAERIKVLENHKENSVYARVSGEVIRRRRKASPRVANQETMPPENQEIKTSQLSVDNLIVNLIAKDGDVKAGICFNINHQNLFKKAVILHPIRIRNGKIEGTIILVPKNGGNPATIMPTNYGHFKGLRVSPPVYRQIREELLINLIALIE